MRAHWQALSRPGKAINQTSRTVFTMTMTPRTFAFAFAVLALLPSLTLAGMYESYEEAQHRKAAEQEAERIDAQWKAGGEAAIPEIIRALCAENGNFYLRYKAQDRLVEMGLPAIRALLQARSGTNSDTLCYRSQLNDAIAGIYCNSDPYEHKNEWNACLGLLRNLLKEDPDEALMVIASIAAIRQHNDCSRFQSLGEEFLPMISSLLRGSGKKVRRNNVAICSDALNAVALIGPPAAPLVKEIIPFLRDPQLAIAAAEALEKIGPSASRAVRELRAAMARDTAQGKGMPYVKALGEIGPAAAEALSDIARLVARLVDEESACDGKNRQQIEVAVRVMCKLAISSGAIDFRSKKKFSGVTDEAIVELLRRELVKARKCKNMPVSGICRALSYFGKKSSIASGELMEIVRDNHESIWTRVAAATTLDETGGGEKLSLSDRQLIGEVLFKVRPQPVPQVPDPIEPVIPDTPTLPLR
jgi:hypothetical protein